MKRITASLIIACLLLGAHAFGQQITFSSKRATLSDVNALLGKQGYSLVVSSTVAPLVKPVSVHVKDVSVPDFLSAFSRNQPYTFETFGKIVTVVAREQPRSARSGLVTIRGKIQNEQGEPIPSATVTVNGSNKVAFTNDNGEFTLNGVDTTFNIVITSVNYEPQEIDWQGEEEMDIKLKHRVSELNIVSVVSDGYQKQTKEKATGSYAKIDNELLNRRVSTNIIDRLEGITSGLVFNKNINPGTNQSSITIRSRSTILANPNPLIVLDNFPYTGDINNINPNDVESITVLKDADAASIWGAFSGNGVIVITTKKGKYQSPLKVSFNSNVTVGEKPDLWYQKALSSDSYVKMEEELFKKGYYSADENSSKRPVLSPVIETLIAQRDGKITESEAKAKLREFSSTDKRDDIDKYFLRSSVNQQYSVNAAGGGTNNHYYFSAGYDKNLSSWVGDQFDRITLSANNTFSWWKKRLEFNTGVIFTESNTQANSPGAEELLYPYLRLAMDDGSAAVVPYRYRQAYKDTAGKGILKNWDYRPLDELKYNDINAKNSDYRINTDIKLKIVKGLDLSAFYQYSRGYFEFRDYKSPQSYYVRNLYNLYTSIGGGQITRGIPDGGIFDQVQSDYEANNFRSQLNFAKSWENRNHTTNHTITSMAGAEIRTLRSERETRRLYGYDKALQTSASDLSYSRYYFMWDGLSNAAPIEMLNRTTSTADNFISYYLQTKYIFQKRYIFSANFRKDESNLFGVKTNQKGVPLWSAGASWEISQEKFYHADWLPYLKLRVTNGYNGNVDRTVYAFTTATKNKPNDWLLTSADIINPPNPELRWEKHHMLNFGLDFSTRNAVVEGSLEYYKRQGTDLIGESLLDPTTGNTFFKGNTADMVGNGVDLAIRTRNLNKKLKWQTSMLFSYATDRVTDYKLEQSAIWFYCDPKYISPLAGKPVYSLFSYKSRGLDPATGKMLAVLDSAITDDYNALDNSRNLDNLEYSGPVNPTIFGSLRNNFSWKGFELSFAITWKMGHYFRRGSVNYTELLGGFSSHPDYDKRWTKPGDEATTSVPALLFPVSPARDRVYNYSNALIEKGDHIRLQDIKLSYELSKVKTPSLPVQSLMIYVYCNNLGIIWKANKQGIDPDFLVGPPNPRTISIGLKTDF